MRLSLLSLLMLFPLLLTAGDTNDDYAPENVKRRLDTSGITAIEGLWQFTGNGATVVIERAGDAMSANDVPSSYNIVMVNPVDDKIKRGTVLGYVYQAAVAGKYDCFMFADPNDTSGRRYRFTLTLNDTGHLSFKREKQGMSVSLWRWIPYLFRVTVVKRNEREGNLDGAVKRYPLSPSTFKSPRYL